MTLLTLGSCSRTEEELAADLKKVELIYSDIEKVIATAENTEPGIVKIDVALIDSLLAADLKKEKHRQLGAVTFNVNEISVLKYIVGQVEEENDDLAFLSDGKISVNLDSKTEFDPKDPPFSSTSESIESETNDCGFVLVVEVLKYIDPEGGTSKYDATFEGGYIKLKYSAIRLHEPEKVYLSGEVEVENSDEVSGSVRENLQFNAHLALKKAVMDQIGYTNGDKLLVITRGYQ